MHRNGGVPDEIPDLLPSSNPINVISLIREAGFASSNTEARRLIKQGAVYVDGERVTDIEALIAVKGGEILKVGKRRFARLNVD